MLSNSGLTSEESLKKIDFYNFTLESFENLIDTINSYESEIIQINDINIEDFLKVSYILPEFKPLLKEAYYKYKDNLKKTKITELNPK